MASLTYRTAGESHGRGLISLVEGMPAGVTVDKAFIDGELRRRQGGFGRGGRQKIETDSVELLSGVRRGLVREFGIEVVGFVRWVGPATARIPMVDELMNDGAAMLIRDITLKGVGKFMEELRKLRDADDLYCPDAESSGRMREFVQKM